ncbi:HisA/HisF-related TIM barrel protein [Polaribacter sp.]|nr:HisA/HisF-related TIM barrel protein [Polaribacter sp.]
MLSPRLIPCLLLKEKGFYKTKKFKNPKYIGDPINTIKIFSEKDVDEICILDISNSGKIDFEILAELASEAFFPLSYGGNIDSIETAKKLFRIGFEKIIINTSFLSNPNFIIDLIKVFGAQSIVVSLDFKKNMFGKINLYNKNLKKIKDPQFYFDFLKIHSPGEIILTSVDNEGTDLGYNINLINLFNLEGLNSNVLINGGASSFDEMKEALKHPKVHSCIAGNLFIYKKPHNAVLINYPKRSNL